MVRTAVSLVYICFIVIIYILNCLNEEVLVSVYTYFWL